MNDYVLIPHDPAAAHGLELVARVAAVRAGTLRFEYRLTGDLARLALPQRKAGQRAERLWEHTCFEAFVAPGAGDGYCELNFSPSTEWAAYEFDGYRHGMRPLAAVALSAIGVTETASELRVTVSADLGAFARSPWPWRVGLTAVVDDRAGGRSYFALEHPHAKPDFHDAAGFTISLDGGAR